MRHHRRLFIYCRFRRRFDSIAEKKYSMSTRKKAKIISKKKYHSPDQIALTITTIFTWHRFRPAHRWSMLHMYGGHFILRAIRWNSTTTMRKPSATQHRYRGSYFILRFTFYLGNRLARYGGYDFDVVIFYSKINKKKNLLTLRKANRIWANFVRKIVMQWPSLNISKRYGLRRSSASATGHEITRQNRVMLFDKYQVFGHINSLLARFDSRSAHKQWTFSTRKI